MKGPWKLRVAGAVSTAAVLLFLCGAGQTEDKAADATQLPGKDPQIRRMLAKKRCEEVARKVEWAGLFVRETEETAELQRLYREAEETKGAGTHDDAAVKYASLADRLEKRLAGALEEANRELKNWEEAAAMAVRTGLVKVGGEEVAALGRKAVEGQEAGKEGKYFLATAMLKEATATVIDIQARYERDLEKAQEDWAKVSDGLKRDRAALYDWRLAFWRQEKASELIEDGVTAEAAVWMRQAADGLAHAKDMVKTLNNAEAAQPIFDEARKALSSGRVKPSDLYAAVEKLEELVPLSATLRTLRSQIGGEVAEDSLFVTTRYGRVAIEFVKIPEGKYMMGSKSGARGRVRWWAKDGMYRGLVLSGVDEKDRRDVSKTSRIATRVTINRQSLLEEPIHEVTIKRPFYIARFPITQGQWRAVMGTAPWRCRYGIPVTDYPYKTGEDYPAWGMTLEEVHKFMRKLENRLPETHGRRRMKFRLPTEQEWEYACRAGSTTWWCCGDDPVEAAEYGWFDPVLWNPARPGADCVPWWVRTGMFGQVHSPQPVGLKNPNAWGMYDMHGNVGEYMANFWLPYDLTDGEFVFYGEEVSQRPDKFICVRNGSQGHGNYSAARRRAYRWGDVNVGKKGGDFEVMTGFRPIIRPEGDCVEDVLVTDAWYREKVKSGEISDIGLKMHLSGGVRIHFGIPPK